jgi:hypothetical protein
MNAATIPPAVSHADSPQATELRFPRQEPASQKLDLRLLLAPAQTYAAQARLDNNVLRITLDLCPSYRSSLTDSMPIAR